jgi:hypothetical protein
MFYTMRISQSPYEAEIMSLAFARYIPLDNEGARSYSDISYTPSKTSIVMSTNLTLSLMI